MVLWEAELKFSIPNHHAGLYEKCDVAFLRVDYIVKVMGWDVVQIGLRHNLPAHDPFATAKEVAKRMNRNVRHVYSRPLKK